MIERVCEYNKGIGDDLMSRSGGGSAGSGATGAGSVPRSPVDINNKPALVGEARALLSAVTRVLLLADTVVVQQLILAKDKVSVTLHPIESKKQIFA